MLARLRPWIRDLRNRTDEEAARVEPPDSEVSDSDSGNEVDSSTSFFLDEVPPPAQMDDYTRALGLIVRLKRPFNVLLPQQQPNVGYIISVSLLSTRSSFRGSSSPQPETSARKW